MDTFAKRLKKALVLKGITQTELSKRTGLDKSLFSNYISGKYKAKSENLYIIAKTLNVSEAWLLGYDVPMEREVSTSIQFDERTSEFMKLFNELTEEQQNLIVSQIKGILSNQ